MKTSADLLWFEAQPKTSTNNAPNHSVCPDQPKQASSHAWAPPLHSSFFPSFHLWFCSYFVLSSGFDCDYSSSISSTDHLHLHPHPLTYNRCPHRRPSLSRVVETSSAFGSCSSHGSESESGDRRVCPSANGRNPWSSPTAIWTCGVCPGWNSI